MSINQHIILTPIGNLIIGEARGYIIKSIFINKIPSILTKPSSKLLIEAENQINKYFAKKLNEFDLPLFINGTIFQKEVWQNLLEIPYGKTKSYKEIAISINKPTSTRAVGNALSKNPICIIIPCHRIINSSGKIGGYAGGIQQKEFLLNLEKEC
jgi:O-6-methylguanine DNA methyltransferase